MGSQALNSQVLNLETCIYQLLSITHKIYVSFDEEYEVRGISLVMPKVKRKKKNTGIICYIVSL